MEDGLSVQQCANKESGGLLSTSRRAGDMKQGSWGGGEGVGLGLTPALGLRG